MRIGTEVGPKDRLGSTSAGWPRGETRGRRSERSAARRRRPDPPALTSVKNFDTSSARPGRSERSAGMGRLQPTTDRRRGTFERQLHLNPDVGANAASERRPQPALKWRDQRAPQGIRMIRSRLPGHRRQA